MSGPVNDNRMKNRNIVVIIFCLILFMLVTFLLFGKSIEGFVEGYFLNNDQKIQAIMIGGGLLALDPLLPVPNSIIATLIGSKFGFLVGTAINSVALIIAAILSYYIGLKGQKSLSYWGKELPEDFTDWVKRNGIIAVLICRPVPILSEASLIISGASQVDIKRLFFWVCLAQIILAGLYAFIGAAGVQDGELNFAILLIGHIGIPAIGTTYLLLLKLLKN